MGLSGMDGSLFQAVPLKEPDGTEYGYVGDITGVNEKDCAGCAGCRIHPGGDLR